jgi:dihydrofolate reductase
MQMSVDGYVAGPEGELEWMTWHWDKELENFVDDLTDSIDTILLGRKMTPGFMTYWTRASNDPSSKEYPFAKKMINTPKIVFSRTLEKSEWENTELASGDTSKYINDLKKKNGKDIIVYGGAGFVSSLVKNGLIDEYYLFINPSALGKGMRIFNNITNQLKLRLADSKKFECGIVLNLYQPQK